MNPRTLPALILILGAVVGLGIEVFTAVYILAIVGLAKEAGMGGFAGFGVVVGAVGFMAGVGVVLTAAWAAKMLHNSEMSRQAAQETAEVAKRFEAVSQGKESESLWYRVR